MFEKKREWPLVVIAIQVVLALLLLWVHRYNAPLCKAVILLYIFICFVEMLVIYHWLNEKNRRNLQLLLSAYRIKRHDIYNSFQILHTMAQMSKREEALKYIKNITTNADSIDNIYRLKDMDTQGVLLELFFYYHHRHIHVAIEVPEDFRLPRRYVRSLWKMAEKSALDLKKDEGEWEIKFSFFSTHIEILSRAGEYRLFLKPRKSLFNRIKASERKLKL